MNVYVIFEHARDNTFFVGVFDSYQKAHYIVADLKLTKSEFANSTYSIEEMSINSLKPVYSNILAYSD